MDDLPDVNVWVALSTADHPFHEAARRYFEETADRDLAFCWVTAMGLMRVTCQRHTFGGQPLSPSEAWQNYNPWRSRNDVTLAAEPAGLHDCLKAWVEQGRATSRNWTDLYLAAFALSHGMRLVTFDKAFCALPKLDALVLSV
jgi:toxin-antitoxin system PIN domain toxin